MKKLQMLVLTFAAILGMVQPLLAQDTPQSLQRNIAEVNFRMEADKVKLVDARKQMDLAEKAWGENRDPAKDDELYKAFFDARNDVRHWEQKIAERNQELLSLKAKLDVALSTAQLRREINEAVNRQNDADGHGQGNGENNEGQQQPRSNEDDAIDLFIVSGGRFQSDSAKEFREFMDDTPLANAANMSRRQLLVKFHMPNGEVESFLIGAHDMQSLLETLDELDEVNSQKEHISAEEFISRLNAINERFKALQSRNAFLSQMPGYPKTGLAKLIEEKQREIQRQLNLISLVQNYGQTQAEQASQESLNRQFVQEGANQWLNEKIEQLKQELQDLVNRGDATAARQHLEEFIRERRLGSQMQGYLRQTLEEMWSKRQQGSGYQRPMQEFPPNPQPQRCHQAPPPQQSWGPQQPPATSAPVPQVQGVQVAVKLIFTRDASENFEFHIEDPSLPASYDGQTYWHNLVPGGEFSFRVNMTAKGPRQVEGSAYDPSNLVIVKVLVRDQNGMRELTPNFYNGKYRVTWPMVSGR